MEAMMPRLLSLLAHHPNYSSEATDLADTAKYILFYVSNIAHEENAGLIFRYAERVKGARDGITPEESDNLYVLLRLLLLCQPRLQTRRRLLRTRTRM